VSLKQNEAEQLIIKMKQLWGNPFKVTSSTAMEWAQHAGDVPFPQMSRAIDYFAEQGDKFPPSLAEVVSKAKTFSQPRKFTYSKVGCLDCGGPTLNGSKHYSFCPTEGDGEFMIPTMREHTAWIDQ
jgi:hypothetical protein